MRTEYERTQQNPKSRKKINFKIIDDRTSEPYAVLAKARMVHGEIDRAMIALAWRTGLKTDKDGHLILGKCVKTTDLQREFQQYDFIILLNREAWEEALSDSQKLALMDHELCHAAPAEDDEGEQKFDVRGRPVFRIRKHDIEEFQEIVQRHGCYKRDLERFAESLLNKRAAPLFDEPENPAAEEQPEDGPALAPAALMGGTHQKTPRPPRKGQSSVN